MLSVLLFVSALAAEKDLVWTILTPEKDARDSDMVEFDRKMDEHLVATMNTTKELRDRLMVKSHKLDELGSSRSAFASLHFDPTKPSALTQAEKKALELYLVRGGFLLLVEDNYPYYPAEFRRPHRVAVFDYLTRELPARNRDFRAERAGQSHPVFHQLFQVEIPSAILRETIENPYYRGETIFLCRDRLAGYTFSLYGYDDGEKWVPVARPLRPYALLENAYQLMVNIYLHALLH